MLLQIHNEKEVVLFSAAVLLLLAFSFGAGFIFGQKPTVVLLQESVELAKTKVPIQWVSGTEYVPGEDAKAIIHVADYTGRGVAATCLLDVFYPDGTTFIAGVPMAAEPGPYRGFYYHNFTVPQAFGVFEERAHCLVELEGRNVSSIQSNTFHVSRASLELKEALPGLVWGHANRTSIASNLPDDLARQDNVTTLLLLLPSRVWDASNRSLSSEDWVRSEDLQPLLDELSSSPEAVWSYRNRTLSSFPRGLLNGSVTAVLVLNGSES